MTNYPEYPGRKPPVFLIEVGIGIAVILFILAAFVLACLLFRDWMYVAVEWFQRVGKGRLQ